MEQLWKKESSEGTALYVDLFASEDKEFLEMSYLVTKLDNKKPTVKKSSKDSLVLRRAGNQLFANNDFYKAIEKYNESLCLAPPNTEFVSMAYANRSMCFQKLNMYTECLVDIGLAKQGKYPEHLMFKLVEREAECLKAIESGEHQIYTIGLKLSYDPGETFPCLANVLNVEKDGTGNYTVTAKEDIGVGKTITVEKAFTTYSIMGHNLRCNICLKRNNNLVPCDICTSALFCHDKCKDNMLHEGECGLAFSGIGELDGGIMKEVRIILMVVDMFHNADELMDFVEKTIKHEPMDGPMSSSSDVKFRYRDFLKFPFSKAGPNSDQFLTSTFFMYKLALEIPKVAAYFKTEKHHRFLVHLIGLHSQITDDNSNWSKRVFEVNGQVKNFCTHGIIGLRNRFFGLSCAPNVMHSDHNDLSVFITIRPVKKGEKLVTFLADYLLLESEAKRQQAYLQQRKSTCKCSRCQGITATSAQQEEITSDPDYGNVSSRLQHCTDVKEMDEKYVAFLNKHGHVPWCDPIGKVIDAYMYFLRDKMSGEGFSSDIIEAINEL